MKRLDIFLKENGLTESRSSAAALIKDNMVTVNGKVISKTSYLVADTDKIEIIHEPEFVSRGGYKLKKAIESFSVNLENSVCMDIGASTGGFTDCMLKNGAVKVFAVDVGTGQLADKLKHDPGVVNMEQTNIRNLNPNDFPQIDFIGCDVSFISLKHVFPVIKKVLKNNGDAVCLVKPQFEAGKENIGKKGIVKSFYIHTQVLEQTVNNAEENGLYVSALDYSPIKGGEGNIEFLILLKNCDKKNNNLNINSVVESAHAEFGGVK